jgi:hypothetical protein
MVTSPAGALRMASVALWPERIKTLSHVARSSLPSARANQMRLDRALQAARR